MITLKKASEKTNSYRPEAWHLSPEPFPAYRGANQIQKSFLGVANGFDETKPSKVIVTKKGNPLIVNCPLEQDENIHLITLTGGFRGGYSKVEVVGGEKLYNGPYSSMHCCPTQLLAVRFTEDNGYLFTETGRRCSSGDIEVFTASGKVLRMVPEEFDAWVEQFN